MKEIFFAPQLYVPGGVHDISFYKNGLGAKELRRWSNEDGSVHVAEFSIEGALFQLHEEKPGAGHREPAQNNGVTALIGLFVRDVDVVMERAIEAGATLLAAPRDYDYGYRQGRFRDPFGHQWMIETKIPAGEPTPKDGG